MHCGPSRRSVLAYVLFALGLLPASATSAQDSYPSQNVRFIVAFPAGGPTDAVARIVGQRLSEKWGQGVVIENRGGAGGNIATRQVAKAEPNGYTVLVTTSAYAVNPSLTANAGYAPETDYKTAIVVATTPNIIVASPGLKASNLKELIETARTEKLTYGMPGPGTTPHLSAERIFKVLAKVDIPHVPFTGAAPLLNALVGGHITLACLAMPPAIELIKSGQIKALAVVSDKRVPSLPDVPTAMEQGFGDSEEFDVDRPVRAGRHAGGGARQAQRRRQRHHCGEADPRPLRPARHASRGRLAGRRRDLRALRNQEMGRGRPQPGIEGRIKRQRAHAVGAAGLSGKWGAISSANVRNASLEPVGSTSST